MSHIASRPTITVYKALGRFRATKQIKNEGLTSYVKCILKTTVIAGNRNWKELRYYESACEKRKMLTKALSRSILQ